jgi:NAD-reducing hydrogenase large subunit
MGRKITIEPVTRVEGHGKVTIKLDDNNRVIQTRLHIVEFRGFERFVQGRPYWEAPVLVQRLCGICPVSHHLCASKAMDVIVGASELSEAAEKIRRLMHYGQFFQSHVLHFFHLASPDLLFGVDSDPLQRNVIGIITKFPELAKKAVLMRKFGQEVIRVTAGKKIHGTGAVPGGVNKHLAAADAEDLLRNPALNADLMVEWALEGLALFKDYHAKNSAFVDGFASFPSNYMSLVRKDGALDLYHGVLRAVDSEGAKIFDQVDYQQYTDYIAEEIRSWTYMKFPFIKSVGQEQGWYRVGPLARLNTCDFIPTPLAQKEFEIYKAYSNGKPSGCSMHMHWARLIEVLHAAEKIRELLADPELRTGELVRSGQRKPEGVGLLEAPRGTLFHHYRVEENDLISMCNLIVSTTSNNEGMNRAVGWVAETKISGREEIPEGVLNQVEVAIRAYDPCLSCATHAVGQMPLEMELFSSDGRLLDRTVKNSEGNC